ncbi:hypothetical protein [Mycobacterium sp. 1274761.0]|uniref:hypothetical protein n=1 Tax=Mycobacterium sp. 1274761.0 TaxID=1834077 RepID=UPI0007FFA0C1|nr:hypothetical protein [Mycobacterium sp. 1274761.0]OBK77873.1 hypothetical protein A5651_03645 [Mycobacterium sp. 1274761.0]
MALQLVPEFALLTGPRIALQAKATHHPVLELDRRVVESGPARVQHAGYGVADQRFTGRVDCVIVAAKPADPEIEGEVAGTRLSFVNLATILRDLRR